jgi:methylthioribose-1-phosphate isomerase
MPGNKGGIEMKIDGKQYRSLWWDERNTCLKIIDQRRLPHEFKTEALMSVADCIQAIAEMKVRGAPLIGVTAAYAIAIAMAKDPTDDFLNSSVASLAGSRPTAVNLFWALHKCRQRLKNVALSNRAAAALEFAHHMAESDVNVNHAIGQHGLAIIKQLSREKPDGEPVRILTHCNAGWLATVDWGTATSPIYQAHDAGISVEVWVDETRPRNQGTITLWELNNHGVPCTYIADNAGGYLMQHDMVDMVIVGTDRTSRQGDVCNKIGTYLKALSARDNNVPFYVALPSSTIDWNLSDAVKETPIEERDSKEVSSVIGLNEMGAVASVQIVPENVNIANPAFDVTPRRLITGLITERGVCEASEESLCSMFSDLAKA